MIGGIVSYRFKKVQVDVFPNGELVVYEAETGKIKCEGKVTKLYECNISNRNLHNNTSVAFDIPERV